MASATKRPAWFLTPECGIALALAVMIMAVYAQTARFDFVNYDDNLYVTNCAHVKAGLTAQGIAWAFTTGDASNWHPLTWIAHMLDVTLFGERPGAHHLVNAAWHLANTLLLFFVLRRMTGALWPSACAAAVFAVHPLHVESVAWVAERKDVMSTFFWLATMAMYAAYVKRRGALRYAGVFVLLALGLLTKPMLVTLPAVLLLLDIWPLKRFDADKGFVPQAAWLAAEKIPLFALAAASSVVTFLAQRHGHSIAAIDVLSMPWRLANAVVAYGKYLLLTVWPHGLAVFYPHPGPALPGWEVAVAGAVLLAITAAVAILARRYPYLLVGWLWYLGTLVPVIGIVQVGSQALADRYTYVPMIGLSIMAMWGLADIAERWRVPKKALAAVGGIVIAVLTVCAGVQASYWRDSISLMTRALAVTKGNYLAHKNLGVALANDRRYAEAVDQYQQGIKAKGNDPDLYYNLGNALGEMGKSNEAMASYRKALQIDPRHAETHYNLGNALAKLQRFDEAMVEYRETLQAQPAHLGALINLGNALAVTHRAAEAAPYYVEALKIEPGNQEALSNLGNVMAEQGKFDQAEQYYRRAMVADPTRPDAYASLAFALLKQKKLEEASQALRQLLQIDPKNARAREQLGQIEAALGAAQKSAQ